MTHELVEAGFEHLMDVHAPVVQIGGGFDFTEGPLWHPVEQYLLFSDIPGNVRRRWDAGGIREVARPSNKGNGMTYDASLDLIVCEHNTSSVVRIGSNGNRQVLASHFGGRELNSPNDVVMRSCGSIYFTDPWYGRTARFGIERPREMGFQGVYRIRPGSEAQEPDLLVDRYLFGQPNGLCFSPDESLLYINDTEQTNIRVFDVTPDGVIRNGRLFASGIQDALKPGLPDGMKCDSSGNVWVTAPGGLWVYSPAGRLLGKVAIPELAANLHWGGPDWRTLFVCASTSVYSVQTRIGPRVEAFMTHAPRPGSADAGSSPPARSRSRRPTRVDEHAAGGHEADGETGATAASGEPELIDGLLLDPLRCALIIQDMQNDVVADGGAFASSGAPQHCKAQNTIANIKRLAEVCRTKGIPVIHVWFVCDAGHPGITLNAPLFEGLRDANALVAGTWGAEPVPGLEALPGDHVIRKSRMSAWEGTSLETVLKAEGRDILIDTGAWTNLSIEHTARTGADKGYTMVIPEDACSTMNADWHRAAIGYALTQVSAVTSVDTVIAGFD